MWIRHSGKEMVIVRVNSYFGMFDLGCLSNSDGSRGGRSTFLFNCGLRTKTGLRWLGLQIIDHQTTNNPRIEHKLWFCFSTTAHSSLAIWVGLHNFSTRKSVIAAISEQPWDWISTAAAALFTTTSNWSWINAGSLEKIKTTKKQRQRKRKIQKQRLN